MGIVILGTGGFAKEVHDELMNNLAFTSDKGAFLGFLDENQSAHNTTFQGYKVLGGIDWLNDFPDIDVVIAIGNPSTKRKVVEKLNSIGHSNFRNVISSKSIIGKDVRIGKGVIICAGSILTTNIDIEDFVTINLSCTIGHDTILESYATIAPGVNISGNCLIKEGVDFGTGATIIQGKTIGEWSIVGAGSVVVKDIPANTTAVGNPSKVIKEREVGWHLFSTKQSVK